MTAPTLAATVDRATTLARDARYHLSAALDAVLAGDPVGARYHAMIAEGAANALGRVLDEHNAGEVRP